MNTLRLLPFLLVLVSGLAAAQGWPARPVKFLVPFPPGAAEVARAAPDGYTVLFAANAVTILHLAVKNLPYETLRDFVAITQVSTQPNAFAVHPVAYARANPGKLSYAHSGAGGGQVITDLLGGQVQVGIAGTTPLIPHHRAGKIKILALTSLERFPPLPEIPTVVEAGFPGFESSQWLGLLAPRGTPAEAIRRLHGETVKALKFTRVIRAEIEQFSKLARELGIEPQ